MINSFNKWKTDEDMPLLVNSFDYYRHIIWFIPIYVVLARGMYFLNYVGSNQKIKKVLLEILEEPERTRQWERTSIKIFSRPERDVLAFQRRKLAAMAEDCVPSSLMFPSTTTRSREDTRAPCRCRVPVHQARVPLLGGVYVSFLILWHLFIIQHD